jgi:hypothetical protein
MTTSVIVAMGGEASMDQYDSLRQQMAEYFARTTEEELLAAIERLGGVWSPEDADVGDGLLTAYAVDFISGVEGMYSYQYDDLCSSTRFEITADRKAA